MVWKIKKAQLRSPAFLPQKSLFVTNEKLLNPILLIVENEGRFSVHWRDFNFNSQYTSKITSFFPYLYEWDIHIPGQEYQAHKGLLMARRSAFLTLKTDSVDQFVQKYVVLQACKKLWMGKCRQDEESELIWTAGKPSGFTALPCEPVIFEALSYFDH